LLVPFVPHFGGPGGFAAANVERSADSIACLGVSREVEKLVVLVDAIHGLVTTRNIHANFVIISGAGEHCRYCCVPSNRIHAAGLMSRELLEHLTRVAMPNGDLAVCFQNTSTIPLEISMPKKTYLHHH